jgi:hypothetical protein
MSSKETLKVEKDAAQPNKSNKTCSSISDMNILIKRNERSLIKNLLQNDLSNEAIHNFLKLFFSSKLVIKIFWTLSLIVLMALCAYLVIETILTYLMFDVSTTWTNVLENPVEFPKITICK